MRRILIASTAAASLILSAGAAGAAGPPDNRGGDTAGEQCEEQKPKAQAPDKDDCDYDG